MSKLPSIIDRLLNPRANLSALTPPNDLAYQTAVEDTARRRRNLINRSLRNPSLVFGTIVTLGLLLVVFFGPFLADQNPHLNPLPIPFSDYDPETNTTIRPPLAPSAEYPLGTDTRGIGNLNNLLHGARITLVTATFVTLNRIILGLIFGSIAGWSNGKVPDKIVMQIITIITAIPMLISGMILIYAIGIEAGMTTFIIALSIIGWTETAQIIRSEILVLRRQLFVEAARSIGLKEIEIVVRHLLPNLVSKLFIISFLEMGAVLILMAELGFLGVFMGGNNRIVLDAFDGGAVLFPDTPEWGAMLSEGVRYLRSKPFVIIAPAMAFFISIIGFNSLGEGLRALFERSSINTAFLLKKRFILLIGGISLATFLIIQNTGPAFWYERTAASFDSAAAQTWLAELETAASQTGETAVEGHNLSPTAAFVYESFKALDIKPGWKEGINSRYIYAPDDETAHVIGFWPGYDLDVSGELIIVFTTYDVPEENDNNYPLGVAGHDLTDLAVLLETIQHMKANDINPRRSLLFVAWQSEGSEQEDLNDYVRDRDNFRRLSTGSAGVRIAPTMVLQIDSGENPAAMWLHPDTPARLAKLINANADHADAPTLKTNPQPVDTLVSSLPWAYISWSSDGNERPKEGQDPLGQYGQTLALTLITLVREEQSWVADLEEIPEPVFIPPTPTPGGESDPGAEPEAVNAVGVVTLTEPSFQTPFEPGELFIARFQINGADRAYLAGQPYENLRVRVSVRSTADDSILTFDQTGSGFNSGGYSTWITLPEDAEAGEYYLEITAISTAFHGNDLELTGDLITPLTIAVEE